MSEFKHLPLQDRIVAVKVQLEQTSKSGLIIAVVDEDDNRDTAFAKVVAVGPGKQLTEGGRIPMTVGIGDYIVYNERTPIKFKWRENQYEILRESDVIMVLDSEGVAETTEGEVEMGRILARGVKQLG